MANKRTSRRREQRKRMMCSTPTGTTISHGDVNYYWKNNAWIAFVSNGATPTAVAETKKKGKPMCYDCECDTPVANERLDYSKSRVRSIAYNKRSDLRKQFKMDAPSAPVTADDLIARITNKQYTLLPKDSDRHYRSLFDLIAWRPEGEVADEAGFKVAREALEATETATNDKVTLGSDADALAALTAFEAWTYTTPAS